MISKTKFTRTYQIDSANNISHTNSYNRQLEIKLEDCG